MHSIVPDIVLKKKPYERTMRILSEHWEELQKRTMTEKNKQICYSGYNIEDVLLSTFEQVIREVKGQSVETTLEAFIYTYRLHHKRAILNCREEKKQLGQWVPEDNDETDKL